MSITGQYIRTDSETSFDTTLSSSSRDDDSIYSGKLSIEGVIMEEAAVIKQQTITKSLSIHIPAKRVSLPNTKESRLHLTRSLSPTHHHLANMMLHRHNSPSKGGQSQSKSIRDYKSTILSQVRINMNSAKSGRRNFVKSEPIPADDDDDVLEGFEGETAAAVPVRKVASEGAILDNYGRANHSSRAVRNMAEALALTPPISVTKINALKNEAAALDLTNIIPSQFIDPASSPMLVEKPKALWTPDMERVLCAKCSSPFTFFRRRHHCRFCGDVFCKDCCGVVALDDWSLKTHNFRSGLLYTVQWFTNSYKYIGCHGCVRKCNKRSNSTT